MAQRIGVLASQAGRPELKSPNVHPLEPDWLSSGNTRKDRASLFSPSLSTASSSEEKGGVSQAPPIP